jgi:hypothetical protein
MLKRLVGGALVLLLGVLLISSSASAEIAAGKIQAVDTAARMIVLEDGTTLVIPPHVKVVREQLREGAMVQVSYEVTGGQNVVRTILVQPAQ